MSRLKRLKSIDDLIENLQAIITMNQCSLSEKDNDLLNAAIAKLNKLRSHKGLTDKHLKIKVADIVELITEFLI